MSTASSRLAAAPRVKAMQLVVAPTIRRTVAGREAPDGDKNA